MNKTQEQLDAFNTLDEFIDYFSSIPVELYCTWEFKSGEKCCARGWLGTRQSLNKTKADETILNLAPNIADINNGAPYFLRKFGVEEVQAQTPKYRVLAYLTKLKKLAKS